MPLVFAAIAPHGGIAINDDVAAVTRAGMEELGRLFDKAQPDAVVVATPHNVHISHALGVVVASRVAGKLDGVTPAVELDVPSDTELARQVLEALGEAGLSAVAVSFGSNDPGLAVAPMDWGVLIPIWFMGGRRQPPVPVVVVTPARDLPASDHLTAGTAIGSAAARSDRRVAFIASADHGHTHLEGGPFGFHRAAAEYDALVSEIVRSNDLDRLSSISPELIENAKADSWWQMLMLHGATPGWRGRFITYEAPTYFGMLTAAFQPPVN